MASFRGDGPAAPLGLLDQSEKQAAQRLCDRAGVSCGLAQIGIEIKAAVDLQLQRVHIVALRPVAAQHIIARIGVIQRDGIAHRPKLRGSYFGENR